MGFFAPWKESLTVLQFRTGVGMVVGVNVAVAGGAAVPVSAGLGVKDGV
jgi:hypothetical protein